MASAWSDLKDGVLRKFCFLEVDLAGHSEIARNNSTRDAEATFMGFLDFIEAEAKARDGQTWSLAGDGGLFAFYNDDVTVMAAQAVNSALAILDKLPEFNATKSKVKGEVRVRIAVHMGDARYYQQTGRIQSDDINFVAHLEKKATPTNSISISANIYRELAEDSLKNRFREHGVFEERSVYVLAGTEGELPPASPKAEPAPEAPQGAPAAEVAGGRTFLRLGREADNDIQYDVPIVSRHHAVLYRSEQGYHLYDLASTNHIYVDGQPAVFAAVSPHSQVTLGRTQALDFSELDRRLSEIKAQGKTGLLADVDFVRFGSALDNEIVLGDPEVAEYQGIIGKQGSETTIYDTQNPARIRVNGQPVTHAPIKPTDQVTIGRSLELPWIQIAAAFEERRAPQNKTGGTTGKTIINALLSALQKNQREAQKKSRAIVMAGGGAVLVLLMALGAQLYFGGDRLSEAVEENRNAVVMIVRKDAPAAKGGAQTPQQYADIGGIRMQVFSDTAEDGRSYGSGFLYEHHGKLVVITNKHVAQPASGKTMNLAVKFQGRSVEYEAEVLSIHPTQDIAVLSLKEKPPGMSGVELDPDWQQVKDGDQVASMSFPLGMQGQESTQIKADLIRGNISNKLTDHIKYTLASAPGASGGPVFNREGKVIAINRGGSIDEAGRHYQGLNWGIPIRFALELLR